MKKSHYFEHIGDTGKTIVMLRSIKAMEIHEPSKTITVDYGESNLSIACSTVEAAWSNYNALKEALNEYWEVWG